jgi:hypothetical protein
MPDFHVVSLRYSLKHDKNVTFNNPSPVEFETEEGRFSLNDGVLSCELKEHFATASDARAAVEPTLRAWEIDAAVRRNLHGLRFEFEKAEVVDRNPPAPGNVVVGVGVTSVAAIGNDAIIQIGLAAYPDPPLTFRITPDVESLWLRYKRQLEGREPLPGMANFCLSVLKARAGGRPAAAKRYKISEPVLRKLDDIVSNRGDRLTARKVTPTSTMKPLTGSETEWVHAAIKTIILRLGDTRSIARLPTITMSDLPKLPTAASD